MRAGAGAAPVPGPTCWKGAVVEGRLMVLRPVKVLAGGCRKQQSQEQEELQDGPHQGGPRQRADRHRSHLNKTTGVSRTGRPGPRVDSERPPAVQQLYSFHPAENKAASFCCILTLSKPNMLPSSHQSHSTTFTSTRLIWLIFLILNPAASKRAGTSDLLQVQHPSPETSPKLKKRPRGRPKGQCRRQK